MLKIQGNFASHHWLLLRTEQQPNENNEALRL